MSVYTSIAEHLVLDNEQVRVEGFGVHAVGLVLVGQVEEDAVGEVEVDLLRQLGLLPLLAEHALLTPRLLGLVQGLCAGGGGGVATCTCTGLIPVPYRAAV